MDTHLISTFLTRIDEVLTDINLDISYREGGWNARQILHHLADAQSQLYFRMKWILSEPDTQLKPFNENRWSELSKNDKYEDSLSILRGVYGRCLSLLATLSSSDLHLTGIHPEAGKMTLEDIIDKFIQHGEAHLHQLHKIKKISHQ